MKAILMINEMPKCCFDCPYHLIYADDKSSEVWCYLLKDENDNGTTTRHKKCPLIEINDNIAKLIEVAR